MARAAAEDKARDIGNLYHQPTIKPGLGSARCPRCFSLLASDSVTSGWTLAPVIRDAFSMVGTAAGGTLGAFHGFNQVMPFVQSRLRGPMWLHFFVGLKRNWLKQLSTFSIVAYAFEHFTRTIIRFLPLCFGLLLVLLLEGVPYRLLCKFQFLHIMELQLLHSTQYHSSQGVLKALLLIIISLKMNLANNMSRGHNTNMPI